MPEQKKKRGLFRRVLKYLLIAVAIYIVAHVSLFIYVFTRPDIPPFDDSALAINAPKVPDNLNSYPVISSMSESTNADDIDLKLKRIKDKRKPVVGDINALQSEFGPKIAMVEDALNRPYCVAPPPRKPTEKFLFFLLLPRYLAEVESILAWDDINNHRPEDAMRKIRLVINMSKTLLTCNGDAMNFLTSESIMAKLLEELNAMADAGAFKPDTLSELVHDIDITNKQRAGMKQTVRNEYWKAKDLTMNWYGEETGILSRIGITDEFVSHAYLKKYKTLNLYYDFYKSMDAGVGGTYMDNKARFDGMIKEWNKKSEIFSNSPSYRTMFNANAIGEIIFEIAAPNFWRSLMKQSFYEASFSAFRLKLAIYSYAAANGTPPQQLNELVPKYIEAVPRDPFDGAPMRYNAAKGIIYSVGADGKDDGGAAKEFLFQKSSAMDLKDQKD